ncbi:MAG TPA: helix-turn-helix transcriptional regulator [Beijerinckiaceae bacterium]
MTKAATAIDKHVGRRVRMRRMLIGMTQEKLGEALGLTFQQVQKYEKGTNRIGASRLHQIGAILGVPVEFFYEGAPALGGKASASELPASYGSEFLSTPEGVQLMKAFTRIRNERIRRRVIDLLLALGESEQGGDDDEVTIAEASRRGRTTGRGGQGARAGRERRA